MLALCSSAVDASAQRMLAFEDDPKRVSSCLHSRSCWPLASALQRPLSQAALCNSLSFRSKRYRVLHFLRHRWMRSTTTSPWAPTSTSSSSAWSWSVTARWALERLQNEIKNPAEYMKGSKELIAKKTLWCSLKFKLWRLRKLSLLLENERCFFYTSINHNCNKGEIHLLPAELH